MCKQGLFATFVVLAYMYHTSGANNETITTKIEAFKDSNASERNKIHGAKNGDKVRKSDSTSQTKNLYLSMRKTPGLNLAGHILEGFLHNVDANKTVFRYSEIQQHIQNKNIMRRDQFQSGIKRQLLKKVRFRRAVRDLPAIMDFLVTQGVHNSTKEIPQNSGVTANSTNTRRRTFENLPFWSRRPVFETGPTKPVRKHAVRKPVQSKHAVRMPVQNQYAASRRRKPSKQKHSLRQLREMERNLHKLSGINRIGRYSDIHQRAEENKRRKEPSMPVMALSYDRARRKMVHIHGPKHRVKGRPKSDNNSVEHEFRKTPKLGNKLVPLKLQGNQTNSNSTNTTIQFRAGNTEEESSKKKKQVIELSPYSLAKQIKEDLIPKLEQSGANITVDVLGRTLEYNDIIMIKAQGGCAKRFRADDKDKFDDVAPEKRIILIVHGLSVMGFNSVPSLKTINGLETLISFYYNHLDQFDIFLIPMANPDGVSAAMMKPFWNKNVSPQSACPGVSLDRNFDVAWNDTCDVSSCSQQFQGTEPFSEPETQAIRDVFHKYSHRIFGYIHVHSSTYSADVFKGDAVLYPKGYSDATTDEDRYIDMKGEIDEMMKNASFKVYSIYVDTLYSWYGKVSGTSVDFASSIYGVPFAMEFTMQLYNDDEMVDCTEERETAFVLNEVWGKVIPIIFDFMFKSVKNGD